jgi:hypothetical protein
MDGDKLEKSKRRWANKVKISKIEAARRQLDCAIKLWFMDGDEVSIHTLTVAAHQIIHDIKENSGVSVELLFDTALVKDEKRKNWIKLLKKSSNFFKHADNDPDPQGELEFSPFGNLLFIVFSIMGLGAVGERTSFAMNALVTWLTIHQPDLISADYRKRFIERVNVEDIEDVRKLAKAEFFESYMVISQIGESHRASSF